MNINRPNHPILNTPPEELIIQLNNLSPGEYERSQRIRIYQFITLVEEILKNGLGK